MTFVPQRLVSVPQAAFWLTCGTMKSYWNNGTMAAKPSYSAFGRTQSIRKWASEFGIPPTTLFNRLKAGRTLEEALSGGTMEQCPLETVLFRLVEQYAAKGNRCCTNLLARAKKLRKEPP